MEVCMVRSTRKFFCLASLFVLMLCTAPDLLRAQPGTATHEQVPPPADFHRPSRNFDTPIGVFQGQSDIGAAVVPGSASYNARTKQYTITSAGYNIWYSRDEFRYLWKKMSGDVSLAADVTFPNPKGFSDRKAVLVIRQNLDDDSKEAMTGEHGTSVYFGYAGRLARHVSRDPVMCNAEDCMELLRTTYLSISWS